MFHNFEEFLNEKKAADSQIHDEIRQAIDSIQDFEMGKEISKAMKLDISADDYDEAEEDDYVSDVKQYAFDALDKAKAPQLKKIHKNLGIN